MKNKLQYSILNECKCGPEPLFVIVSFVNPEIKTDLTQLIEELIDLQNKRLIECFFQNKKIIVLKTQLEEYFNKRNHAKEDLEEPSDVCDEFSFVTTDAGLLLLNDKDKPIKI